MDHLHHHHHAPLHWGYSGTAVAHPHSELPHNTWVPPPTAPSSNIIGGVNTTMASSRKLKRAMSESDCEDLYSEESSKEQTSPGESDSCHMMSRKKRRGVIEKKRRDRINLSLCELKRLVPSAYEKQGSAKLEKAEILQLTVDHLKTMHSKGGSDGTSSFDTQRIAVDYHIVGFRECASEVARYLVTMEGMDIQDPLRLRLMSHLQCFVAQRELQLKNNNGSINDVLSPAALSATTPSTGNIVSPNMGQSATPTNWSSTAAASYHQQSGYHHMMPTTTNTYQQDAYSSQTATAQSGGGYVPNLPPPLPHQYDQYGRSTAESAGSISYGSDANSTAPRTGVTTRSQANNNSATVSAVSNDANNTGSSSVDQSKPTYIDLTSASSSAAATSTSSTATSSSANNNRLQHNYNIYGHIHYPAADPTSAAAAYHPHHAYNLHLDPTRGYNGGQGGNGGGNAKPYRPWGAEMAY